MNIFGAVILVVLLFVVFSASRAVALQGIMAGVLYLTQFQQLDVAGFNLYALRFIELAGFCRVMLRGEFSFQQLNRIDRALLWLYGCSTLVFLLRSSEGVANQLGAAVDAFLCYFTFRGLMAGIEDFRAFLRALVMLLVPYTLLVLIEGLTGKNPLAFVGGITGGSHWMRHGFPRCFGSFRQPDTLGMFAASFLPLFVGLARDAGERKRAVFGIGLCLILALASNSGGAASGTLVGMVCWFFWRFRTKMRTVRWGIVAMLVLLALVMKAPIWYIFSKASAITGGDGWYRSYLIDVAYQHLGLWWLAGMPLTDTRGWMPTGLTATGGADITNQYLNFGLVGGVGAILLLVVLLKRAFGELGLAMERIRSDSVNATSENEYLLWGLGAMLTVHVVNWFGIVYFDQMYVVWFLQLAAVSTLSEEFLGARDFETLEMSPEEALETGLGRRNDIVPMGH
jgi:hypothetical protein